MEDAPVGAAVRWLADHAPEMEALLLSLVNENSHTSHRVGCNRVGDLLGHALACPRLACMVHESTRFAPHRVWSTNATGAPAILVGHVDTVFPPGAFEGYRSENGLAFGPGVHDMKGGLVVATYALLALDAVGALDRCPLRFVVVSDEEVGSPESQSLLRAVARGARCGLVFEGGRPGDAVITRRKGTGGLTVRAFGRAAHAGNAHSDGVNAIWAMARFVDAAQRCTDHARQRTVNVGRMSGGTAKNTVPDHAQCDVDLRFSQAQDGIALVDALRAAAETSAHSVPGSRIEIEGGISRHPMEPARGSLDLLHSYWACARQAGLGTEEAPLVGGGSDANTLSAAAIPTIDGLGPRGSGFHTHDERIELATLRSKAEAIVRLLLSPGFLPERQLPA